jgi:hypothetical protein
MSGIIEQGAPDSKTISEWTVAKEVIGTFIGVSPFVVALVVWGAGVNERMKVVETRIDHIEAMERRQQEDAGEQRREILARLDRVGGQIEVLQQLVAARGSGILIRPQGEDPPQKYRNSGSVR